MRFITVTAEDSLIGSYPRARAILFVPIFATFQKGNWLFCDSHRHKYRVEKITFGHDNPKD